MGGLTLVFKAVRLTCVSLGFITLVGCSAQGGGGEDGTPDTSMAGSGSSHSDGGSNGGSGGSNADPPLNTDNPDTAKIIHGLISSLLEPAIGAIPDKQAQELIKRVKMSPRENEIVWEADVAAETVATYIREQMQPKPVPATTTKPVAKPKRRVRRK